MGKRKKKLIRKTAADKRITVPLARLEGSATFTGHPSKELLDAVNAMAELAYKNL